MFKILIADDERFIRKGISAILKRGLEEEIQFVEAGNGIEAIDLAQKENFHLVISDISMPGSSGLEFIKALKDSGQTATVIILSGYENFEYAREAVRLGVREYVMKPVKKPEFLELVRSCLEETRQKQEQSVKEARESIANEKILNQVKEEVLVQLLNEKRKEVVDQYLERLEKFGITFHSSLFICAVIEYEVTDSNREYIDFVAKNMVDEFFKDSSFPAVTVEYCGGRLAAIMEFQDQNRFKEEKAAALRSVTGLIKKYCKVRAVTGVGDIAFDAYGLNKSLRHAIKAAEFKIYDTGSDLFFYSDLARGHDYEPVPAEAFLKEFDEEHAVMLLNALEPLIAEPCSRHSLETVKKCYEEVCGLLNERTQKAAGLSPEPPVRYQEFRYFWSFIQMKQELKKMIRQAGELMQQGEESLNYKLIHDILQYLEDNITKDIDLNTVAEQFSRTPGYISTLFKKSMNCGFNTYVTEQRMSIARKLLEDSSIPIQKVGELCGYPNSKYFSVVFKKNTGENPKRYREKIEKRPEID